MPFYMPPPRLTDSQSKKLNFAMAGAGILIGAAAFFSKPKTKNGRELKRLAEGTGLAIATLGFVGDVADNFNTEEEA